MPGNGRLVNPAGGWGSAYGSIGLPRPTQDFTDGAFGPFSPILSVPVDEADAFGRVPVRREQYQVGWNLPTGQPGDEPGMKLASFAQLRTIADLYSVARACIQFIKAQVASLEWDITPTPDAAKAMRNNAAAMKDFGERRGKAIKFFKRPDPDYDNWSSWMSAVMEEVLVYDALSIVSRRKWGAGTRSMGGRGLLGSDLDCLELISGSTIRPLYNMHGARPRPPAVAYQQYLYGVPRVDLMTIVTERDIDRMQTEGNDLKQIYRGDQLMYVPIVPRRWTPYGFPPVERGLIPITTGLAKQGFQKEYFTEGTVPAVYISPGSDLSPNQIRELQDALNAFAGDQSFHQKIIVLPMGSKVDPQRPAALADQFDEIVMAQVCMAFGVQPMQIGISPKVSTTQSPGASNQMAKMAGQQQDRETLMPILLYLTAIMEHVLHGECGQHDMQFVFSGMTEEEDEETTTNLIVNQISHGLLTIDEGRDKLGLQPFGMPETSEPGVFTPTGFMTLAQGTQMLEKQLTQPALPFGAPGQEPEGPDGPAKDQGPNGPTQQGGEADGKGNPPKGGGPTGGKPASPGPKKPSGDSGDTKKPSKNGGSSGHVAASEAAVDAQEEKTAGPSDKPDDGKTEKPKAVTKAADPAAQDAPAQQPPAVDDSMAQDAVQALIAAWVAKQLYDSMMGVSKGSISFLDAVTSGVLAMKLGYLRVLRHAVQAAVKAFGVDPLSDDRLDAMAAQRAESQRQYITGMAASVNSANWNGTDPESWLPARTKLYGEGLSGAWNQGYGETVKASEPDTKIVWRLGEAEHCPLCVARDGQEFTFETLPGWPGDGGFGGPICLGGPACHCHLDLVEGDKVIDSAGNTQRPEAPGYYAQQRRDITARRADMAAQREQFVSGLPNQTGSDGTSAQSRAMNRDDLRRRLAQLANERIRSTGGYPGVSVEPADIPASLIASLLPQYGAQPEAGSIPVTELMDAVESMFAGKFTEADMTKGAFTAVLLAATAELLRGDSSQREISSELDALARHVLKGRDPGSWTLRHAVPDSVGALVSALKAGKSRAQAVRDAIAASRRRVDNAGQVIEPEQPEVPLPPGDASGLGGPEQMPHDAHDIFYDASSLREHVALKVGPKGYVHGWIKVGSGGTGPDVPNTGAKNRQYWSDRLNGELSGPGHHSVPSTASSRKAIAAELDRQGLDKNSPLRGVLGDYRGSHLLIHRDSSGKIDAGVSYTHDKRGKSIELHEVRVLPKKQGIGTQMLSDLAQRHPGHTMTVYGAVESAKPWYAKTGATMVPHSSVGYWDKESVDALRRGAPEAKTYSGAANKGASDLSDPNPVDAEHVMNQLRKNYPEKALTWMKDARWVGPVKVPTDRFDTDDEDSWAASHESARVDHFADEMEDGQHLHPIISVQEPGESKLKVIDGHHRYLAYRKRGKKARTYIGFVDADGGPWDETHAFQDHQDADQANKAAGTPGLTKRSGMVSIDLPDGLMPKLDGGVDDIHHITLACLGKNVSDGTLADVLATAKRVAAGMQPFTITAGGVDSFPPSDGSDGKIPAFVPVDLSDELKALRAPFAQYHASEHQDFKPHITLKYLDEGEPLPDPVDRVEIPVDAVHIHLGGKVYARIPFGPGAVEKSAETAELSTVHKPLGTHGLWGDKMAQLPAYIQNIVHAMIRDGHDESEAIQLAIGAVKRWAEGGGKVTPEVRAAAAGAVAEWEKLKAEHNKAKAVAPDLVKVGPKGYIHGWIFVGVPGVGDEVRHPEHGKGTITEHSGEHVTVSFHNGKTHSFQVHRHEGESHHFTKRGDLEHEGPHKPKDEPKKDTIAESADKVFDDPKHVKNLSDDDLEAVREELMKRHAEAGVWGEIGEKYDDVRSKVQREIYDRDDIRQRAVDMASAEWGPGRTSASRREDLQDVLQDTERRAKERGVDPDMIPGHRQARVELNRRVFKNPAKWNSDDHLHIFGGTPEQQQQIANSMKRLTADVPPDKGSTLAHINITDSAMKNDPRFHVEDVEGLYYPSDHHMEINPRVFNKGNSSLKSEDSGWYSDSRHPTTLDRVLDHEFGHHLDYDLSEDERNKLFTALTGVIGKTKYVTMPAANRKTFVQDNKAEIVNKIGTYAATNDRELVAELWANYHGLKLNSGLPAEFKPASAQIVGRYLTGHDTPYNPEES